LVGDDTARGGALGLERDTEALDAELAPLEPGPRAVLTGVDDIQGYNPIHLARYEPVWELALH